MDFGKDKKIENLKQKVSELSENLNKLSEKQNSQYTDIMLVLKEIQEATSKIENEVETRSDDELYEEAKEIAIEHRQASSALLQRILRIGYARAARLIDQLEEEGIIGPANGSRPREVLIQEEED